MRSLALVLVLGVSLSLAGCGGTRAARPAAADATVELDVPVANARLHVWAVGGGSGVPVIVLHGGPGLSHEYTRPLARLGGGARRVAFYDQRGTGRSPAEPEARHDLAAHVADLDAVRAALGAERAILVGHSWGGLVALAYVAAHPERVERLILVDSLPPTSWAWMMANRRFDTRVAALVAEGLIPADLPPAANGDCSPTLIALLPAYYHDPRHPATRDLAGSRCHDGLLELTWEHVGAVDLTASLAAVSVPALVIQGQSDPFGRMADDVAAALPRAAIRTVYLPACGHLPWEECPRGFFPEVGRFLTEGGE